MQQSAYEHAALIWTRLSNTIRARGMYDAAREAGHMSAPDDASKSALKRPLAHGAVTDVAQTGLRLASPLPQTDLSYDNSFGYAKRSEAVEDRGANLDLGNLALEVPRREALTEQFHTVHFCLNAPEPQNQKLKSNPEKERCWPAASAPWHASAI